MCDQIIRLRWCSHRGPTGGGDHVSYRLLLCVIYRKIALKTYLSSPPIMFNFAACPPYPAFSLSPTLPGSPRSGPSTGSILQKMMGGGQRRSRGGGGRRKVCLFDAGAAQARPLLQLWLWFLPLTSFWRAITIMLKENHALVLLQRGAIHIFRSILISGGRLEIAQNFGVTSSCIEKLFFFHLQGVVLRQDLRRGVIMGNHSLVLQSLSRNMSGTYHCVATNDEGTAYSNALKLDIKCEYSIMVGTSCYYGCTRLYCS